MIKKTDSGSPTNSIPIVMDASATAAAMAAERANQEWNSELFASPPTQPGNSEYFPPTSHSADGPKNPRG